MNIHFNVYNLCYYLLHIIVNTVFSIILFSYFNYNEILDICSNDFSEYYLKDLDTYRL